MRRKFNEKLRNGSRPEEIAQARANVESVKAEASVLINSPTASRRCRRICAGPAVVDGILENANAVLEVADAKLDAARRNCWIWSSPVREKKKSPRPSGCTALMRVSILRQQLKDADLVAPVDAVVRTRIMEPGEIAFPQRPVLSLAVTDPKWVRAHTFPDSLGKLRPGIARISGGG